MSIKKGTRATTAWAGSTKAFTKDRFMQTSKELQRAYQFLQREGVAFVSINEKGAITLFMHTLEQFMGVTGGEGIQKATKEEFGCLITTYSWKRGQISVVFEEGAEVK